MFVYTENRWLNEHALQAAVKYLFPGHKMQFGARKLAGLEKPAANNPERTAYWELDVWIPSLNLGFEFQVLFCAYCYAFSHIF